MAPKALDRAERKLRIANAVKRQTGYANLKAAVANTPGLGVTYDAIKRVLSQGFGPHPRPNTVEALKRLGVFRLVRRGGKTAT